MPDRITANLPARDCGEMRAFFERLGFSMEFCSESWLIKARGPLELEFFLEPATSACVRVGDLDGLFRAPLRRLGS